MSGRRGIGGRAWAALTAAAAVFVLGALLPSAAAAQGSDGDCLTADPPQAQTPAAPIRFGITPLLAGTAGSTQSGVVPESRPQTLAALEQLQPRRRELVLRLNRMFFSDGVAGIRRYAAIVDDFADAGFETELQIRYHPTPAQEGDMKAWRAYVKQAVKILGKRPSVVAFSITNEANFPISANTSDGSFDGVRPAVVTGVVAAQRQLRKIGRTDIELGFPVAWRWIPSEDASFWTEIGERATPAFRHAIDYVGIQIYPGLVFPPVPRPGVSAGREVVEALSLLRDCYMPKAGLGDDVDLWVSENGYATNLGRSAASQQADLASTLRSVHAYSGELGISDYRYFNLRDNDSAGTDLFDAVGLLTDGYVRKPAFATLRKGIATAGTSTKRPKPRGRIGGEQCNGEAATIVGTHAADLLTGTHEHDVIVGAGGGDRVFGGGSSDEICGGPGGDLLVGGHDTDRIIGGGGYDSCRRDGDWISGCETGASRR